MFLIGKSDSKIYSDLIYFESIAVPQNQTELYMTWEKNCPNKGSTVISSMSSFNVTTGSVADNWFNQLGICSISNLLTTSNYDLICFVVRKHIYF